MKFNFDTTPMGSRMTCVTRFLSIEAMEQSATGMERELAQRCPNSTQCLRNGARRLQTLNATEHLC